MLKIHAKNLETIAVLSLQGRIVNGETEMLRNAVRLQLQSSAVILDLAQVTTVDAHGLGVLLDLRSQVIERGARFKVINVNQPLSRIFEITRLDSVFEINSRAETYQAVPRERHVPVAA
jgi:anti-anti-sigma factor